MIRVARTVVALGAASGIACGSGDGGKSAASSGSDGGAPPEVTQITIDGRVTKLDEIGFARVDGKVLSIVAQSAGATPTNVSLDIAYDATPAAGTATCASATASTTSCTSDSMCPAGYPRCNTAEALCETDNTFLLLIVGSASILADTCNVDVTALGTIGGRVKGSVQADMHDGTKALFEFDVTRDR
jgi:hypothetical protein